jgi:AraC-like DNA-binding protein
MIDNFNIKLLFGGLSTCDITWSRGYQKTDDCFKIYIPVHGESALYGENESYLLMPGRIYLISGYKLKRQECLDEMRLYWFHFLPESLILRHIILSQPMVISWPLKDFPGTDKLLKKTSSYFVFRNERDTLYKRYFPKQHLECLILSFVLNILSVLLEDIDYQGISAGFYDTRLKKVVEYMDSNYIENPGLDELSRIASLSKVQFLRNFKKFFKTTPFNYMLRKRLELARFILSNTSLPITEVAAKCGYYDEGYFTRIFKKELEITPSGYRKKMQKQVP